ncbi:hypothetical protein [Amycolatopsis sp. PS_44_ISF1]|uniref:hypothetical protein n=1 Tax=Amycolatopsis sp. PS_44_ISF1 TaxID=2974917 RepID=UPI0028DEA18C|nr:hypothetical protein [Amycolatopsis sp. PS_44_ISF1]MDT8910906.1 hypothetical protein [Amycolatopsis sp. PS_44_ISF1]
MRVLLLRSLGGHPARTVIEQDQAAADWLLSIGLAVAADAEPTGPAEAEPAVPVASESTRPGRRPARAATPGG